MNGKLISDYSWEETMILTDSLEMLLEAQSPRVFSINLNKFAITELFSNVMLQEPCSKHIESQAVNRLCVCQQWFPHSLPTKQTGVSHISRCFNILINVLWGKYRWIQR